MRNLLALLAAAALTFFGLGWYLDWYHIQSTPTDPGHRSVTIDVNTKKIGSDLQKGSEKIQNALDSTTKEDTARRAETTRSDQPKKPSSN
jgi:hypothetical protein